MGGSPYKRGYRGLKAPIVTNTKTRKTAKRLLFPILTKKGFGDYPQLDGGIGGSIAPIAIAPI